MMLTLCRGEVFLAADFYPTWPGGFRLYFHENGGRLRGECLDASVQVWRFNFNLTVFDLARLSLLTRWLPTRHNGHRLEGFRFGWTGKEPA